MHATMALLVAVDIAPWPSPGPVRIPCCYAPGPAGAPPTAPRGAARGESIYGAMDSNAAAGRARGAAEDGELTQRPGGEALGSAAAAPVAPGACQLPCVCASLSRPAL